MPAKKIKAANKAAGIVANTGRVLILLAHGSRSRQSLAEMRKLVLGLQQATRGFTVTGAYLELARPGLPEAVEAAVRSGAREIHVLPMFLFTGKHAGSDVPALVAALKLNHPSLKLKVLTPLGRHPGLLDLLRDAAEFA